MMSRQDSIESLEDVFEVEKIVDAKLVEGVQYYKVRWRGYGSEDDTLEPIENLLTCQEMVEHFWKDKEEARKAEKLKKKKKAAKHKEFLEDVKGAQHSSDDNQKPRNKEKEKDVSLGSAISEERKRPVEGTSTVVRAEYESDSGQKSKTGSSLGQKSELVNRDNVSSQSKSSDERVKKLGGESSKELFSSSDKKLMKESTANDGKNTVKLSGKNKQTAVESKQITKVKKKDFIRQSSKDNPVEVSSDSDSNDSNNSNEEDRTAKMLLGKWGEPKYKSNSPCFKMEVKGSPKSRNRLMTKSYRIPKYSYDEQKSDKGEGNLKKMERRSLEGEFEKQVEMKEKPSKNLHKEGGKPFERDAEKRRETKEMSIWGNQNREVIQPQKQNIKMVKKPEKGNSAKVGENSGSSSATEKSRSTISNRGPIAKAASFKDIIQEGIREHEERVKMTPEKIKGQGSRGDTQISHMGYILQKQKSREMSEQAAALEKQSNPFARVNQLPRTSFSEKKTEKRKETEGEKKREGSIIESKDLTSQKVDKDRAKSTESRVEAGVEARVETRVPDSGMSTEEKQVQKPGNESILLKKIKDLGRTIETLNRGEGSTEQLASILGSTEALATEIKQRTKAATTLALTEVSEGDTKLEERKSDNVTTGDKQDQSKELNTSRQSCESQADTEGNTKRDKKDYGKNIDMLSGAGQTKGAGIMNKISLNMGRLQSLVKGKLGQLGKSEDKSRDSTPGREGKEDGTKSPIQKPKSTANKGNLQGVQGSGSSEKSSEGGDFKDVSSGAPTEKLNTNISGRNRDNVFENVKRKPTQLPSSEVQPLGNSPFVVQRKNSVDKQSLGREGEATVSRPFVGGKDDKGPTKPDVNVLEQASRRSEKDLPEKRKPEKTKEIIDGKKKERERKDVRDKSQTKDGRDKVQTNTKGKKPDKKLEIKGSSKPKSPAVLDSPVNLQNMFEFTKVKTVGANEQSARPKGGVKRGLDGGEKSDRTSEKKKLKIDPTKVRYANQRQPSKEAFTPAKDDILGGILGRSEMMRSIDSKADKKEENKDKKDKEKQESDALKQTEADSVSDTSELGFDLDDYYVDDDGLFPDDNDGEIRYDDPKYLDTISTKDIKPVVLTEALFAKAVREGDWTRILGAVADGMDPDYWDAISGGTLLWKAIESDQYEVTKKLLKFGANPNYRAENGKTALMVAVESGKIGFVSMLLKAGAHINVQQHNEETALILACRTGHEDIINLLLNYGADARLIPKSNAKDVYEFAPDFEVLLIKKIVEKYNRRLSSIAESIIKQCLGNNVVRLQSLHSCRCISPGEKKINEFHFRCKLNAGEKGVTVILLCMCAEFKPSGDVILHLHRKQDNGVETVILNKEHQIPVVEGNHSLYFLFPNMGQVNSLMVRTHKTGYRLIVGVYAAESNESWIDNKLDSFYKEFGTANEMIFEQPT